MGWIIVREKYSCIIIRYTVSASDLHSIVTSMRDVVKNKRGNDRLMREEHRGRSKNV
jgi:hypothetical protein